MAESKNTVSVDLLVNDEEAARDAFRDLRDEAEQFDRTLEDSFKRSSRSVRSFSDEAARSLQSAQREALSLQRSFQQLSGRSPFKGVADESERAAAHAYQLQQRLLSLYQQQSRGRPLHELNAEIDETKLKLEGLRQQYFRLQSGQVAQGDTEGGGGGAGGGGARVSTFGLRRAIQTGAQAAGLPGIAGQIGGLEAFGGPIALLGLGIGAVAGVRELIKLQEEASKSNLALAVSARDTGRSFAEASADAATFRASLIADREEAVAVAAAFGQLKLATGEALKPGAAEQLSTIATARGLTPEETAKAISGLSKGSKEAFEQLTGQRADVVLDRYARSIGTTTARLTEMQKVQALTNATLRDSANYVDLAERRLVSFGARMDALRKSAGEFATDYADAFIGYWFSGERPEDTYRRKLHELGADKPGAQLQAEARQAQERREQEAEANRQQGLQFAETERLKDLERSFRAVPEDFGAGLQPLERQRSELARLREQREQLQTEYEAFRKIKGQFSTEDAERFEDQFKDRLQGLTDSIRQQAQAAAEAVRQSVLSTRETMRSFLADAAARADRDNPFTALFAKGRLEIEETRKRFLAFGSDFADMMARIKEQEVAQEAAVLRLQTSLSALRATQEARRLEAGAGLALTGPEERHLAVTQARAAEAVNIPQLLAEAAALQSGRALDPQSLNSILVREAELRNQLRFLPDQGSYQANQAKRQELQKQLDEQEKALRQPGVDFRSMQTLFEQLRRIEALRTAAGGRLGDATRDALNQQLLTLTGQIDPRVLASDARFAGVRDLRSRSLVEQAQKFERDVRDAQKREEVGNLIQQDAREQLEAVRRAGGVTREARLKDFLAITGQLSEKELTPELRRARVDFLREQAQRDSHREQEGERRAQLLENVLKRLNGLITAQGIKVDAPPAGINIKVGDGLTVDKALTGAAPTAEQVED